MKYINVLWLDIKNLFTNIAWLFYGIVFPLLLIIILGYLTHNDYGNSIRSYDYYGVTLIIFSILNTGTIAANSFMEDKMKMGNMRIVFSPIHLSWVYISKIIASAFFNLICHCFVVIILLIGFQLNLGLHIGTLFILMMIGECFGATLGVCICCVLKSESLCNQILSLVIQLAAALGGVFFSLDRFGDIFTKLSYISPIKWMIQACFMYIYDGQSGPLYLCMGVLIIGILICLWVCQKTWHGEDCL
ncbi:ABC transporter permease [Candidatus Stoquefichus sp. SB1]|uniref:ABC transporter permease n=1 Tax=Candidatus Stoquefichus sp. SB1 TaxID=1658109 RepID=UPI00067EBCEB|nr:ABC transporter permease [Candidatus Stoquefichus sp. SB1]